ALGWPRGPPSTGTGAAVAPGATRPSPATPRWSAASEVAAARAWPGSRPASTRRRSSSVSTPGGGPWLPRPPPVSAPRRRPLVARVGPVDDPPATGHEPAHPGPPGRAGVDVEGGHGHHR